MKIKLDYGNVLIIIQGHVWKLLNALTIKTSNMKKIILLFYCSSLTCAAQKFAGLALTPPMGWNSWNTFQTNITEDLSKRNC